MPYNTRRKSLSLPSLGIHIPMTHAARAAASKSAGRLSLPASSSSHSSDARARSPDSHPSKRLKKSHDGPVAASADAVVEHTPPPSPKPAASIEMADAGVVPKIDLASINDDIVEASVVQLRSTANRPHLIKELATVLSQSLTSVQQSANPCAIISSRLTSFMKRPCWSSSKPCPLAKELETVHPRRTYFFLTTCPRQSLPDPGIAQPATPAVAVVTPSVSLTDDSGSDDVESRRRILSPSPEIDLSAPEFDDADDMTMPMALVGSFKTRHLKHSRDMRHDSPPLERDEREFTQTADVLQRRKLSKEAPAPDAVERNSAVEYGYRDDVWFGDTRLGATTAFLMSPAMKPSVQFSVRKEDEADQWLKFHEMIQWEHGAETIEIDELDGLFDGC
ncbi:mucin [Drechmeria coniospora]|uniref:Mucin n=1 Tax=Drechmeria coniospora TaxID=98403 RepID=A0A151GDH4_DRECN|nr:mucin [Drechmeria coniospora]KYK55148.1 mucin [Drechmeria coniospora]